MILRQKYNYHIYLPVINIFQNRIYLYLVILTCFVFIHFRMVRLVAEEFLTDERDRKYYADNYRCCPPPLFILLITIFEVNLNKMSNIYIVHMH